MSIERKFIGAYYACQNCGSYSPVPESGTRPIRCSKPCTVTYRACTTCGRYFAPEEGYTETECSRACTLVFEYRRGAKGRYREKQTGDLHEPDISRTPGSRERDHGEETLGIDESLTYLDR